MVLIRPILQPALLLSLFLLLTVQAYSQTAHEKSDRLWASFRLLHSDSLTPKEEVLLQIDALASQNSLTKSQFEARLELAKIHSARFFDLFDEDVRIMDSLHLTASSVLPDTLVIDYHLTKGFGRSLQGFMAEALDNYLQADSISTIANLPVWQRSTRTSLASYYTMVGEHQKSISILQEIRADFQATSAQDSIEYIQSTGNMAIVFSRMGSHDSAIFYLKQVITLPQTPQRLVPTYYYYLGESYLKQEHYDSALVALETARDLEKKLPSSQYLQVIYLQIAKLYMYQGNSDSSTHYFNTVIPSLQATKSYPTLAFAYKSMLNLALQSPADSLTLNYFSNYQTAIDSINKRRKQDLESKYEVQFETLQKEADIQQLELEAAQQAKNQLWLLLASTLLLLVLSFFIYRNHIRQKILAQQLRLASAEEAKAKAELSAKNSDLRAQINALGQSEKLIAKLKLDLQKQASTSEIVESLERTYITDQEWDGIVLQFQSLHPDFFAELKQTSDRLTKADTKLSILLKLGYSSAASSEVLKISKDGVRKARQRLRDKVGQEFFVQICP